MHRAHRASIVLVLAGFGLCGCAVDRGAVMIRADGVPYPGDHVTAPERLGAGNVDQYGSGAYNRWGAGYDQGVHASDRKLAPRAQP
ncbi:MAG TPA: hypothetical protein VF522_16065 [Ramlibacter sp.]|uniref:hypothetical protein n=1 Tax=Ramlibacter sp. TaxID=1917967 RepID=UPI002ED561D9